ncbi:hypothetical protein A9267_17385 [Shewanella sp. UCD-FRSSP16_17]|uniref:helix-turn-helix domain-containing protein n=1 Tax=Shewanella sp. UCD-FRSSP16_17 TaxID=1853256 RepID=UPI0007EEDE70|nr:helix-turn-helix domain-containing protein [Shewanella sp. UCD-FRSSP16_17]OBT04718.1 hypothetical protein A9267_17385 [Shewanella sp. UCD-FRSSP16_17]
MRGQSPYSRVERILEYIHRHIDQTLGLDDLVEVFGISRWQLQRIFQQQTGLNVAQYVRELKLSLAAEKVLTTHDRMLDIAYQFGFTSEVSFSRSFKQLFGLSPSQYRRRGTKVGLRNPITQRAEHFIDSTSLQTRIEHRPEFTVYGISSPLNGLLEASPNVATIVPNLWETLFSQLGESTKCKAQLVGVVDTQQQTPEHANLHYWAALQIDAPSAETIQSYVTQAKLSSLVIPTQDYAVVSYHGLASGFSQLVEWLICDWLPQSGFDSVNGFELEHYGPLTSHIDTPTDMEYWLPIRTLP